MPLAPPVPDRLPGRSSVVAGAGLLVAGGCWFAQCLVPWTAVGPLSRSSVVDVVRLVRTGGLDASVSGAAVAALLALPALGLLLVALVPVPGRAVRVVRTSVAALGVLVSGALLVLLADADPGRLGPGGWLVLTGGLAALGSVLVLLLARPTTTARTSPSAPLARRPGASTREATP